MFRIPDPAAVEEATETLHSTDLAEQLEQANATLEYVQESLADVELGLEDRDWRTLSFTGQTEFTREGLLTAARLCRVMAVVNPLIRRGLNLRTAYVWGDGVQINARATGQTKPTPPSRTSTPSSRSSSTTRPPRRSSPPRPLTSRTSGPSAPTAMLAVALFTKPLHRPGAAPRDPLRRDHRHHHQPRRRRRAVVLQAGLDPQ